MKVAVLSDIHDEVEKLDSAINTAKNDGCAAIIFCGDACTPFTIKRLSSYSIPTYITWGNADQDSWTMTKDATTSIIPPPPEQEFSEIILNKQKIAFTHFPKIAHLLASSQHYDAVFHGDSHIHYQKKVGKTLLANPGAISGIVKGKPGKATFMIYDTSSNSVKLIQI